MSPSTGSLLIRGRAESDTLAPLVRAEVSKLDANLPAYRFRTMAQVERDALWNGRVSSNLFLMLTFIAVALSTVGLYAVTAHGVTQRAQEIGLRMALGARPWHVTRLDCTARRDAARDRVHGWNRVHEALGRELRKRQRRRDGVGSEVSADRRSSSSRCWPRWPAWSPRVERHAWIRLPRSVRKMTEPLKNRAASTPLTPSCRL